MKPLLPEIITISHTTNNEVLAAWPVGDPGLELSWGLSFNGYFWCQLVYSGFPPKHSLCLELHASSLFGMWFKEAERRDERKWTREREKGTQGCIIRRLIGTCFCWDLLQTSVTGTRWEEKHCLSLPVCTSGCVVSVPVGSHVALYHWSREALHRKQECVSTLKWDAKKKKKEWKPVWKQLYHNQMWLEMYTKGFQGMGWYSSWDPRVTMQLISNVSEVKYLKSH